MMIDSSGGAENEMAISTRGTPAKVSGLGPRQSPLSLAGCPQLIAAPHLPGFATLILVRVS